MIKEKCIEFIEQDGQEWCTKLIRLRAVGATLFVELVKRDPDSGEEVVKDLAHLPRETYFVSEPYFGEFFATFEDGKLVATSWSWRGLLRVLKTRGYYVARSRYLSNLQTAIPYIRKTISIGLSEDGEVVDPLGILDKTDYGAEPLKAAYKWIKSAYDGRNAEYAWYNILVAITHVVMSPLRDPWYLKNHFLDYVVYNVAPYSHSAIVYILEKLLGGFHAFDEYHTVVYDVLPRVYLLGRKRTAATLVDLNRLPLVLAGQTKKTLKIYSYVLKTVGGGFIELDRQGRKKVPNLRGIIIFADDLHNIPALRRLVLRWDPQVPRWDPLSIPPLQQDELPPIKPIYGFAAKLWRKYSNLFGANKLPYLVPIVAETIAQEICNETEEVATFTERVVDKITNAFVAKRSPDVFIL